MTLTFRDTLARYLTAELAERRGFTWEPGTARYRDNSTGKFASESAIRGAMEHYSRDAVRPNVERLTQRFTDGKITLPEWQERVARELKDAYIVQVQAGRGGVNATTFADYGRIGGRLRFEYRHLNQFAQEIKDGRLSAAEIKARAAMYAEGSRTAYYDGLTAAKNAAGFTDEMRVLHPAEHCEDCIAMAGHWQPIGTLPEPGIGSVCMHNCQCTKEYR